MTKAKQQSEAADIYAHDAKRTSQRERRMTIKAKDEDIEFPQRVYEAPEERYQFRGAYWSAGGLLDVLAVETADLNAEIERLRAELADARLALSVHSGQSIRPLTDEDKESISRALRAVSLDL